MNIGLWNIRGVGKPNLQEELTYTQKFNSLNILALFETKCQKEPTIQQLKNAGFNSFTFVPSMGLRGGMWLLWNLDSNCSDASVDCINNRWINCSIKIDNTPYHLIFIYVVMHQLEWRKDTLSRTVLHNTLTP